MALVKLGKSVGHADLHSTAQALLSVDMSQTLLALGYLTDLDKTSLCFVPFSLDFGFPVTGATRTVLSPELVSIFVGSLLNSSLANRANDHVKLVSITSNATSMVLRPSVLSAKYFSTILALEWHEITLAALR